jgi:phosphonate transport system substrate-binding protein
MSEDQTLVLGAVAYAPKVVTIWDGFKEWFARKGFDFDYILYSNYERQVAGHFASHYHVAWNSPLAWVEAERIATKLGRKVEAVAMRDTDCDLHSLILVKADSPIAGVEDLRGKRVAVGAKDSPQATLIPRLLLAEAGLEPGKDFELVPFDLLVGKHGDHVGGEREAVRALLDDKADCACLIEGNLAVFSDEGTIPSGATRVLTRTGAYDHCNFTVLDDAPRELVQRFCELLFSMSYDDPEVQPLLEMEGLRAWKPGRSSGYALLEQATERFGTVDEFVDSVAAEQDS